MTTNHPTFDPLSPELQEDYDMFRGYMDAGVNAVKPPITSAAYDHGWRARKNDRAGVADDDQRELARRLAKDPTP